MTKLNNDAQGLRTIYNENDVDRIENEVLRGGEGSGSGSGSGGYGGGVIAGSDVVGSFDDGQYVLNWTEGYLTRDPFAGLSLSVEFNDPDKYDLACTSNSVHWIGYYGVTIDASIQYNYYPNGIGTNPSTLSHATFVGAYTIPTKYRKN